MPDFHGPTSIAQSSVGIANMALTLLGEETITSFDDQSKRADLASSRFADVRDAVIRAHPWNVARARSQLNQLAQEPAFEFDHQYQLPNDMLRLLKIHEPSDGDYQIEGDKLLISADPVKIIYIRRIEDVSQMDESLKQAIAARLAFVLALPLTSSTKIQTQMFNAYRDALSEARHVNAMELDDQKFEANDWLRSAFGADEPFRPIR